MTPQEKYVELRKLSRSPDGLRNTISTLFTDPEITWKTVKDINEMADKVIFFFGGEVVFQLILSWNINYQFDDDTKQQKLTEQYKFLLNQN